MVHALQLTVAAALLAAGYAAPTTPNTFSVKQVASPQEDILNGVQKTANVYRKFNKEMPAEVAAAAAVQTGTVKATPGDQFDSEYLCPVAVGGKVLQLDFDTGSSDLWVFSNLQPAAQRAGHDIYTVNPAKRLKGATWKIKYGDGSGAAGVVYKDKVNIGGATVISQAVEAATSVSTSFARGVNDGLVGLAFDSLNTVQPQAQKTFFTNVKPTLPKKLFTADLRYHEAGSYDFGFIDSSKYTGQISYINVNPANGWWEFIANGYAIGSGAVQSASIDGIADTGTTLLYLPAAVVSAYYAQVQGAQNSQLYGGYVFPCSATLPSFTMRVGQYKAVVPGKYMNYAPVQTGSSTCYGGIQPNTGIGFSIFGDIFLKSQFVVFDGSTQPPRLGLAAK